MQLVLQLNLFAFQDATFKQLIRVAMGRHPVLSFPDVFIDIRVERNIWEIAESYKEVTSVLFRRFLAVYKESTNK